MNRFHDDPVGFRAMGQPATYLTLHGTRDELAELLRAIDTSTPVLNSLGPVPCQPEFGCHHLHIVVLGDFNENDLDEALAELRHRTARTNAQLN